MCPQDDEQSTARARQTATRCPIRVRMKLRLRGAVHFTHARECQHNEDYDSMQAVTRNKITPQTVADVFAKKLSRGHSCCGHGRYRRTPDAPARFTTPTMRHDASRCRRTCRCCGTCRLDRFNSSSPLTVIAVAISLSGSGPLTYTRRPLKGAPPSPHVTMSDPCAQTTRMGRQLVRDRPSACR